VVGLGVVPGVVGQMLKLARSWTRGRARRLT
jgi:hypothetical protein